jgi:hypothetical protein
MTLTIASVQRVSKVKSVTVVLGVSSLAALSLQLPAHSAGTVVIDTKGPNTVFGNGLPTQQFSFESGGIGLTFSNPLALGVDSRSRTVPNGTTTLPSGGTCLGGSRDVNHNHVCGNLPESSSAPQINSIQLIFNESVYVRSMTITARSQVDDNTVDNSVTSFWSGSSGTTASFDYMVNTINDTVVNTTFRVRNYVSPFGTFLALAGQPITVSSTFNNNIDYWIKSIEVERVPGPLPVLGVASAFAWSRRLRRKTQSTTK